MQVTFLKGHIWYINVASFAHAYTKDIIFSQYFFLIFLIGIVEPNWVHSAMLPLIGLLCQPRVIMMKEKLVKWLAGKTEVLGENLPTPVPLCPQKPHMLPEREPGPTRWEASV
jgi:hypothetical protein